MSLAVSANVLHDVGGGVTPTLSIAGVSDPIEVWHYLLSS